MLLCRRHHVLWHQGRLHLHHLTIPWHPDQQSGAPPHPLSDLFGRAGPRARSGLASAAGLRHRGATADRRRGHGHAVDPPGGRPGTGMVPGLTSGEVSIPAPAGPLPGYVAVPDADAPSPGVVVLPDMAGMTRDLRRQADWLAEAGYLTVAPDLFRGGRRAACIVRMVRDTRRRQGSTFADVEAVRRWLAQRPDCTGSIGVVGSASVAASPSCSQPRPVRGARRAHPTDRRSVPRAVRQRCPPPHRGLLRRPPAGVITVRGSGRSSACSWTAPRTTVSPALQPRRLPPRR